jgi:thiol-disulfide isomerase/thioredoxin
MTYTPKNKMTKKNLLIYGLIALLFGATGAYFGSKQMPAPVTTTVAPTGGAPHTPVSKLFASSMDDTANKKQAMSQWQGKALLINFWAPWCGPCVEEMPELDALAKESAAKQINIIGIGIDTPTNLITFAAKHKISYPLYMSGMAGTDLAREFGNTAGGLPFTVLIGADGQIKKTYLGRLKFDELKADLAALKS